MQNGNGNQVQRVKKVLKCTLTIDERLKYTDEMIEASQAAASTMTKKKSIAKQLDGEIEKHTLKAGEIGQKLADRFEHREVECEYDYDYQMGEVRLVRLDTYELVDSRAMTAEERQVPLPIAEETAQVDPEAAAQADADAAIEKQISEEEASFDPHDGPAPAAEEDPSGLPQMTEEIAEQIENNWGDKTPPWKHSQPQAEQEQAAQTAKPSRRKRGKLSA